ncbi:glycosyltransferase [Desulfatirhabdium butyrativorans]|uniref:glycosyltransferase n=1 Tax=Desulfatirhabdium butyrativorans TaxID=340467 RepID=UPI0003F862EB|nr:glycosyltransferase [Desulfatirhabdium butyrativorans]
MAGTLAQYSEIVGEEVIDHLKQLAKTLSGARVVHVNSTRQGGGVAEILSWLIPLKNELGLNASWEVIEGDESFYQCTKSFHNAIQGNHIPIPQHLLNSYEETNQRNAERLRSKLEEADFVFIHDPQPAAFLKSCPGRKGKWIWRCHIDVSHPYRPVWKYLRQFVEYYDASIWSLAEFAQPLSHPAYLVPPSIDPLSEKNIELSNLELRKVLEEFDIDPDRPIVVQVSRFDRFKDPVGAIQACRLAKSYTPFQLILAGGGATDDPEGDMVFQEVKNAADNDPDIHILLLPPDAHRKVNALQRIADIILQKSVREGFGLTVTEGLWKGKPVIGGETGGIKLQVVNHYTGFLVKTPEGAALRIRYLLKHQNKIDEMGRKAKEFVRENFLLTRHLREYLTIMAAVVHNSSERIEIR